MRKVAVAIFCLAAVVAISLILFFFYSTPELDPMPLDPKVQERDFNSAKEYLQDFKADDALAIIQKYKTAIESDTEIGKEWLELFIQASNMKRDKVQLVQLYEFAPDIFVDYEDASILVADHCITRRKLIDFQNIRELWKGRETKASAWFFLDIDSLLIEKKRKEAIVFLENHSFPGKKDLGRLVRLALIYFDEDPKVSWGYLEKAYYLDPVNRDVRLYRAKVLESTGENSLAHREYKAAKEISSNNPFFSDQLAEFYIRQRKYDLALNTWQKHLHSHSWDQIWVKAIFWNKVIKAIDFNWESQKYPQGKFKHFIAYLLQLKSNEYWDNTAFDDVSQNTFYLKLNQETFWLRLLSSLKEKNEETAYKLLKFNHFSPVSWRPDLELALKRILVYRKKGILADSEISRAWVEKRSELTYPPDVPELFKQLEDLAAMSEKNPINTKIPDDLHNLLISDEAFTAAFLAAGWVEAALNLHTLTIMPNNFPDWYAPKLVAAYQENRSNFAALEFATKQLETEELILSIADIMFNEKDMDAALEKVTPLIEMDSQIGYRAAVISSKIFIDKKEWENAKNIVNSNPRLVGDIVGKEILSRIAHLEGNKELADRMYASIKNDSTEAKSYLARKAFMDNDWTTAKELTEDLIEEFPDNPMLRENLRKIVEFEHIEKQRRELEE